MKQFDSKGCLIIVGIFLFIFLVYKGLSSVAQWLDNLSWYISIPILAVIGFAVYHFGKERNWW